MKAKLSKLETPEGRLRGFDLKPGNANDVIIASPPKCGTTWMQQIVHTLRSGGSMEFDEISCVIPCLEMGWDCGIDPQAPQSYSPAAYKTHFSWPFCPSGCKKIFVIRDPEDVGPSFYHFFNGWYFEANTISMGSFLKEFFLRRGEPSSWEENASVWFHITSWYPHRKDEDVLWLHFEDLKEYLPQCVALIAEFIGCGVDNPKLQELAVKQASFEFMSQNSEKYDEHPLKLARNVACGLPEQAGMEGNKKVRQGKVGTGKELDAEMKAEFEQKWKDSVEAGLGFSSYSEMRASINAELQRPW
eukprot:CAMPEP_0117668310 /NCGR_PEP_ID=MMETSP0804-20121206/11473_1 /TAXON_ID=1074897 /ORGANISM="Tetraselmis astigmatica, Strain CCMP880" /LENGTH=301 /DNA_ID=CAMNT_0005476177 /DNA_START=115 /DNA_END=1017 /DNA_ORIENTATION=+